MTIFSLSALLLLLSTAIPSAKASSSPSLLESQYQFTDFLTNELYEPQQNECSSSLGVSMALGLVYPASVGVAREELNQIFGYDDSSNNNNQDHPTSLPWSETTSILTETYKGECPFASPQDENDIFAEACSMSQEPIVEIVNSVWVRDTVVLNATYAAALGDDLLRTLDFTDSAAGETVNAWASESSSGLIDSIVENGPFPDDWVLVALNSIFVKASWQRPFTEGFTNQDKFYTSPLRDQVTLDSANFMHQVARFSYSKTAVPGYQMIRLPFSGSNEQANLSMILVLPYHATESGETQSRVLTQQVVESQSLLENTRVALAVPKFKIESTYDRVLKSSLEAVGLKAPFQDENSFCILDTGCNTKVDQIVQKTVIDVNEHGVTASAVTAVGISLTSFDEAKPELMICNHPFQFFIYDDNQKVVLFEGMVHNPGAQDGATFLAKHTDTEFWSTNFGVSPTVVETFIVADAVENDTSGANACLSVMKRLLLLLLSCMLV